MPLHLLGKKSWNVYNTDNVERVKRDEAEARAAEEQAEHDRHQRDAEERLKVLRGLKSDPKQELPVEEPVRASSSSHKRKRNESDEPATFDEITDYRKRRSSVTDSQNDGTRSRGARRDTGENVDNLDRISNMKFRDAGGKQSQAAQPWYLDRQKTEVIKDQVVGKDVWGNDDPGRKERNKERINASDPLLAMKKGVKQLRDAEKQGGQWKAQRERDLYEVEDLARRHHGHRKRRSSPESDARRQRKDKHRHRHHHPSEDSKHYARERSNEH